MDVALYCATREWVEGTGNDFWPPPSYVPDGATWGTCDGSTAWGAGGGDYDGATDYGNGPNGIIDLVSLPAGMSNGWVALDATAVVRAWVEDGEPNHGVLLRPLSGGETYHYFGSSEYGTASRRPKLTIGYGDGADGFLVRVNFQPAGAALPSGYCADYGSAYGAHGALYYGWR